MIGSGFVYIVGSVKYGWYKFGRTAKFEFWERIRDIERGLPIPIVCIRVWRCRNHAFIEKSIHRELKPRRMRGEWFQLTLDEVRLVIEKLESAEGNNIETEYSPEFEYLRESLDRLEA